MTPSSFSSSTRSFSLTPARRCSIRRALLSRRAAYLKSLIRDNKTTSVTTQLNLPGDNTILQRSVQPLNPSNTIRKQSHTADLNRDLERKFEILAQSLQDFHLHPPMRRFVLQHSRLVTSSHSSNPFARASRSSRGLEDVFAALEEPKFNFGVGGSEIFEQLVPSFLYAVKPDEDDDVTSAASGVFDDEMDIDTDADFSRSGSGSENHSVPASNRAKASLPLPLSVRDVVPHADPDPKDTHRIQHFRSVLTSLRISDAFLSYVQNLYLQASRGERRLSRTELAERFAGETAGILARNLHGYSGAVGAGVSTGNRNRNGNGNARLRGVLVSDSFGVAGRVRNRGKKSVRFADDVVDRQR